MMGCFIADVYGPADDAEIDPASMACGIDWRRALGMASKVHGHGASDGGFV
jgi:hypothetical protein